MCHKIVVRIFFDFHILVDSDATRLVLLGLRHRDVEDAVLEVGSDTILINTSGEIEATSEFANASLRNPVLGLVSRLVLLGLLCDLAGGGVGSLNLLLILRLVRVLDCSLVGILVGVAALGDGTLFLRVLEVARGRRASSVDAFRLATNYHDLRVGEFDVNVVLVDSGQLAVELVSLGCLADIELGLPVREAGAAGAVVLAGVVVKVVKKTEERSEGGSVVVELAREESHID